MGGSTTMRRSKSMPAAEKRSDDQGGKSNVATPTLRKSRTSVRSGSSNLPKATSAATTAGAGSVATKVRKKGSLPKKMVLPFSYTIDDPRHYHVESVGAEGRICPEFLPP